MPVYTYRREDGTTFEEKQGFLDEPLTVCPTTGQKVVRIIQKPNVIFKGTGFYVNDSKSASKQSANGGNGSSNSGGNENATSNTGENGSSGTAAESDTSSTSKKSADGDYTDKPKQVTPIPTKN